MLETGYGRRLKGRIGFSGTDPLELYCVTPMREYSNTKPFCMVFSGFRISLRPILSIFSEGEVVET